MKSRDKGRDGKKKRPKKEVLLAASQKK